MRTMAAGPFGPAFVNARVPKPSGGGIDVGVAAHKMQFLGSANVSAIGWLPQPAKVRILCALFFIYFARLELTQWRASRRKPDV